MGLNNAMARGAKKLRIVKDSVISVYCHHARNKNKRREQCQPRNGRLGTLSLAHGLSHIGVGSLDGSQESVSGNTESFQR
jgi:hypothetical protein